MQKDLSDLNKVWEVKPLKMAGENEARKLLEKVAQQVQPMMYEHKWKVQLLSEFCPSNPSLMGLNIDGGGEIKLRLRRPERQWDFFTCEQILDTMLHELCHNEHGPHNTDFYKLLDELRLFRQHALAAAERRAQPETVLPSGLRRIGGDSSLKAALSPIHAAAMTPERRMRDELWCGSTSLRSGGDQANNASSSTNLQRPQHSTSPANPSASDSALQSLQNETNMGSLETWQCNTCTLINKPLALTCEACQTPRSTVVAPRIRDWSCKFCTLINSNGSDRCSACGEWKYSYESPSIGYTPHVDT